MELATTAGTLEAFVTSMNDSETYTEEVTFPNGRGVSIIRHHGSYGYRHGKFEVAVLDANGTLDYSTPVTDDVLGWQSVEDVLNVMKQVADLPPVVREITG